MISGKMMQVEQQSDAEKKFWARPELVEKLFSVLDLESTLSLARVIDQKILQQSMNSKVWKALLDHSYPSSSLPYWWDGKKLTDELREMIVAARNFAAILKLMKKPRVLLLDLLHSICESYPSENQDDNIQLVCHQHDDSHDILGWGVLLLEEAEGTLGTREQSIKLIEIETLREPILSALGSRMSRQLEESDFSQHNKCGTRKHKECSSLIHSHASQAI